MLSHYWHCPHLTVRCPSVRLSVLAWDHSSKPTATGLLLRAWRTIDINRLLHGRRSVTLEVFLNDMRYINPRFTSLHFTSQLRAAGECGQCHVISVRRKLSTNRLCYKIESKLHLVQVSFVFTRLNFIGSKPIAQYLD